MEKKLDPNMIQFLIDHPAARSKVYCMMRNAATTRDDPRMVEWLSPINHKPCEKWTKEQDALFDKLCVGLV